MTAIIIEDEIPAGKRLQRLIETKGFTVLAILYSVKQSIAWLKENAHPDLVFMDIRLRDGLCFGIFEKAEIRSKVVFTTAFDEYALKAFDYNSLDYLLKPIDEAKLDKLLVKLESFKAVFYEKNYWNNLENLIENHYKTSFLVNSGMMIRKIETDAVSCFFSGNNVTYIVSGKRQFPLNQSLEKLETSLDPKDFFRISRKYIVAKKAIKSVGNDFCITIEDFENDALKVSRQRKPAFIAWYQK